MLSETLPFAFGIASSPIPLIPLLLLLLTPRARASSSAFVAGWYLGIFGATAVLVVLGAFIDARESPRVWVPWALIVVGCLLIFAGIRQWIARDEERPLPGWLQAMQSAGPLRAFQVGLLVAVVNPKIILFALGAAAAISAAMSSVMGNVAAIAIFTAIAVLPVAIPVALYLIVGEPMLRPIRKANTWLRTNYLAVSAAVFVILGVIVIIKSWQKL